MKHDEINNPAHYQLFPDVEAIDVIKAALTHAEFIGYLKGSALKYRLRAGDKGPAEKCIGKSRWYQNYLRNEHESRKPDRADLGDFGQQNMFDPTVKESLTVGGVGYGVSRYQVDMPKWADHVLVQAGRLNGGTVYAKLSNGQYLSKRGRIYNMRRWAVVSQKFTPEPASEIDDDSPRQQRIHQNGELGQAIYAAIHGDDA